MIRLPEQNSKKSRTNRPSAYDVESLLAPTSTSQTTTATNSSKLTAKVQPFEVRENDLMESSNSRPENVFPKGPRNPAFYPGVGYPPFGSPLSLANLHLYQLWSAQAGFPGLNWPLFHHANPVITQSTSRTQTESNLSDSNSTYTSRSQTSVKHQSSHSNEGIHFVFTKMTLSLRCRHRRKYFLSSILNRSLIVFKLYNMGIVVVSYHNIKIVKLLMAQDS